MTVNPDGGFIGTTVPIANALLGHSSKPPVTHEVHRMSHDDTSAQPSAQLPGQPSSAADTITQVFDLLDRDDVEFSIYGQLLGFSSSRWEDHSHPNFRFAQPGERCSACRWFEIRIFRVLNEYDDTLSCSCGVGDHVEEDHALTCGSIDPRSRYLVLTYGRSDVPGEMNKRRASWTNSPFEVLSLLTQRQRNDNGDSSNAMFLPTTSNRALAQASDTDPGIREAYMRWMKAA